MEERVRKRCIMISANIKDKLLSIQSELASSYQSPDYLLEKIKPIVWDANVLQGVFEDEKKLEDMKRGEDNEH